VVVSWTPVPRKDRTELGIAIDPLTPDIAYRAGHAHVGCRLADGRQQSVLADFLIGAHAASIGATPVTRDRKRFATYFPDLTLITPETHHG
jgi:predicted nucleic acid-binding protein